MEVQHIYKAGDPSLAPILLLHSTGGDEHQLLPIAEIVAPNHPVLSIRGRISENGVNRYFRLKGQGFTKENFDLESLELESKWLAGEIKRLADEYGLDSSKFVALGYSNGANIALHMTLTGDFKFDRVIAFHGMQITEIENPALAEKKIFLSHAPNDPIVPIDNFNALVKNLELSSCQNEIFQCRYGHQLTEEEIQAAKTWLAETN